MEEIKDTFYGVIYYIFGYEYATCSHCQSKFAIKEITNPNFKRYCSNYCLYKIIEDES